MSQSGSQWKRHPRLKQIECSPCGRIRNVITGTVYKATRHHSGYEVVTLTSAEFPRKQFSVHRLIAETFIGSIPQAMCVNHIDGRKSNNAASNLEIVTYQQNALHSVRVLGNHRGDKNGNTKVFSHRHAEMLQDHASGMLLRDMAKKYNVNRTYVCILCAKLRKAVA